MKDNEVLIRINKDYRKTLQHLNIYEDYKNDSLVGKAAQLSIAKENVQKCLNGYLVDMHGLEYWASEVERLRKELKELI